MIVVGLTGVIGTGKSTAASLLKKRGLAVIDMDALAKQSLGRKETQDDIRAAFGDEYVKDGRVDVAGIRDLAFHRSEELRKLEAIVHPRVRGQVEKRMKTLQKRGVRAVVFDHPLLFETGFDRKVDRVVVVTADAKTIRKRLKKRGMEADDIERRLSFQIPLGQKVAKADHVINNNGTEAMLEKEIDLLLEKLDAWEEERNAPY